MKFRRGFKVARYSFCSNKRLAEKMKSCADFCRKGLLTKDNMDKFLDEFYAISTVYAKRLSPEQRQVMINAMYSTAKAKHILDK